MKEQNASLRLVALGTLALVGFHSLPGMLSAQSGRTPDAITAEISTFVTFDVPGATNTSVYDIDDEGTVTGTYHDASLVPHGFVRTRGGKLTTFSVPGSASTFPSCLNSSAVAGTFTDPTGATHGFLFSAGQWTRFYLPGAPSPVLFINGAGTITGTYTSLGGFVRGFLRDATGAIFHFDPPGSVFTQPTGINSSGTVVGFYYDVDYNRGFSRSADGTFTVIDVPGAVKTYVMGLNDIGAMTGYYLDAANGSHGFLRSPTGALTTFDVPFFGGVPLGINNSGTIFGMTGDSTGVFLRGPSGKIAIYVPPAASSTSPTGINNKGVVTGHYQSNGKTHGFLLY
ncbi:MAG: hypothetical protein ABI693_23575 [Bryobacteraceae bacterium]